MDKFVHMKKFFNEFFSLFFKKKNRILYKLDKAIKSIIYKYFSKKFVNFICEQNLKFIFLGLKKFLISSAFFFEKNIL